MGTPSSPLTLVGSTASLMYSREDPMGELQLPVIAKGSSLFRPSTYLFVDLDSLLVDLVDAAKALIPQAGDPLPPSLSTRLEEAFAKLQVAIIECRVHMEIFLGAPRYLHGLRRSRNDRDWPLLGYALWYDMYARASELEASSFNAVTFFVGSRDCYDALQHRAAAYMRQHSKQDSVPDVFVCSSDPRVYYGLQPVSTVTGLSDWLTANKTFVPVVPAAAVRAKAVGLDSAYGLPALYGLLGLADYVTASTRQPETCLVEAEKILTAAVHCVNTFGSCHTELATRQWLQWLHDRGVFVLPEDECTVPLLHQWAVAARRSLSSTSAFGVPTLRAPNAALRKVLMPWWMHLLTEGFLPDLLDPEKETSPPLRSLHAHCRPLQEWWVRRAHQFTGLKGAACDDGSDICAVLALMFHRTNPTCLAPAQLDSVLQLDTPLRIPLVALRLLLQAECVSAEGAQVLWLYLLHVWAATSTDWTAAKRSDLKLLETAIGYVSVTDMLTGTTLASSGGGCVYASEVWQYAKYSVEKGSPHHERAAIQRLLTTAQKYPRIHEVWLHFQSFF